MYVDKQILNCTYKRYKRHYKQKTKTWLYKVPRKLINGILYTTVGHHILSVPNEIF